MENNHTCAQEALCTNTIEGFNCDCLQGWEGNGHNCTGIFCFQYLLHFFFFSHFQDVEPPEFVLIPDDIIISSEPGQNYGKAHWLRVLAKDNSERFGFNMSDVRSFEHEIQGLSKDGMEWMGSDEIYFTVFVGWMGLG